MMTLNKPYEIFWLMKNPFWSIPIVQTIFLYIKKNCMKMQKKTVTNHMEVESVVLCTVLQQKSTQQVKYLSEEQGTSAASK